MTIRIEDLLAHARDIVQTRYNITNGDPEPMTFAVACIMDHLTAERTAHAAAVAQGHPVATIQQLATDGTEAHGDEFYGPILDQLTALREHCDLAFRRGVHTAVQAIVDDFASLVQRRDQAHAPQNTTEVVKAMALRLAALPMPWTDPGPVDPAVPAVPAAPRPDLHTLIQVASLAAEESGLPIRIEVASDGLRVIAFSAMTASRTRLAVIRQVSWAEINTAETPVLSIAVAQVIEELRGC